MITLEKLKIFEYYGGSDDAFAHASLKDQKLMDDGAFFLISSLLQDIHLIQKGLASPSYEAALQSKLTEACDCEATIQYFNGMTLF